MEDAYRSERSGAAERIAELEAYIGKQAEAAVAARANRPITVQKELDAAHKQAADLAAQLAEAKKKLSLQSKRALDAETRMEALQKEVQRARAATEGRLSRALNQPSPRAGSPLIGMGAFGLPSPRGGADSPRGDAGGADGGHAPAPATQPSPRGGFGLASPRQRRSTADDSPQGHAGGPGGRARQTTAATARAPPPRHPGPNRPPIAPAAYVPAIAPQAWAE